MTDDVTRSEILDAVTDLVALIQYALKVVYALAAVIAAQIVLKVWETARVVAVGRRVERQLDMAAQHGAITDSQKERAAHLLEKVTVVLGRATEVLTQVAEASGQASRTAEHVTHAVDEVPHRTAEAVVEKLATASTHAMPAVRSTPRPPDDGGGVG